MRKYLASLAVSAKTILRNQEKKTAVVGLTNGAERRNNLLTGVLQLLNQGGDQQQLIAGVLNLIKGATGFDAVGLRLRLQNDYPYFEQDGFSDEFLIKENSLCARNTDGTVINDEAGRPVYECTCGLILSGRTDPALPFFTAAGSFWTNFSHELLALPVGTDPRVNPRNRCIHAGYHSVGLFPVKVGTEIIGILQLNDRRSGMFTPELLALLENLAHSIGIGLRRVEAETLLRLSEERVRHTLENVLSPEGNLSGLELSDLMDAPALQKLMDDFYAVARVPMSIIDAKGQVLVGVGWQDVCTRYHRVQSETCRHCLESDLQLSAGLAQGQYRLYKCKNNMWDIATPIVVAGRHLGNLFSGQFFFENEVVDRELFRGQARQFGFDEEQYLAALDRVPRLSRETIDHAMAFFLKLADMISQLAYSNVKLARLLADRKRIEEELRGADRRKDEFLAMLAHELRNPMAAISAAATLLSTPQVSEDNASFARRALKVRVHQLSRLVDDLLDVSRFSSGKIQLKKEQLDLSSVIHRAVESTKHLFHENNQQLGVHTADELVVYGDPVRLEQAVANLLTNAAKYMDSGGTADVAGLREGRDAVIRVKDNGCGITADLLSKIFDLFQQADTSLDRTRGGLGIGLTVAKKVVELHDGTITARSDGPGLGSVFEIRLPLSRLGA